MFKYIPEVIALSWLLCLGCATTGGIAGEERRPTLDEMNDGRVMCRALCSSYARDFLEYRYDGKCVCKSNSGK